MHAVSDVLAKAGCTAVSRPPAWSVSFVSRRSAKSWLKNKAKRGLRATDTRMLATLRVSEDEYTCNCGDQATSY